MTVRSQAIGLLGSAVLATAMLAQKPLDAPTDSTGEQSSLRPVSLERTQLRRLNSERVGQEYQIRIWLPQGYEKSDKPYPVLYLLDGDLMFGMATDIVQYLQWGKLVPELIIVAPAYGSIDGPENGGTNMRDRDFSVFPAQDAYVPEGGERFLGFLREELIPYIDSTLRTDSSDRTLAGFSRGVDLVVYTLFTSPDLFRRYVGIDNFYPEYLTLEQAFATQRKELRKNVFFSSRFPRGGIYDLVARMRARGYAGLDIDYADANPYHFAVPADGLTRGLASVFSKRPVYPLLLSMLERRKVDAVLSEYARLKQVSASSYDFGESQLADLCNALVQSHRLDDAIRVCRLNLQSFPQSSITYRRLGTAYERLGHTGSALVNYRRALQLNPNDAIALAAVQRLQPK